MARQHRLCVVAALTLLTSNACGTQLDAASETPATTSRSPVTTTSTTSSTPPPSPPAGGETSPPNQENRCTATMLAGTVEPMDSDAGNRYVTLVVRNTSQQPCTLWGYGGLELLNSTRQPIPTDSERNLEPAPTLVTLGPGGTAGKNLHWSVVATGGEPVDGPCQPQAKALNVIPPDETAPFTVNYEFGSVCAEGRIDTSAYFPR